MSIVYGYYEQGSSGTIAYASGSATNYSIVSYTGLNHVVVTPTVNAFVVLSETQTALSATTANAQYISANVTTLIPAVSKKFISARGASASGTLYITEFLGA
jgi:hypothetical protein